MHKNLLITGDKMSDYLVGMTLRLENKFRGNLREARIVCGWQQIIEDLIQETFVEVLKG